MKSFNVVVTVSTTICVDANTPEDAIKKVQKALDANDAGTAMQLGENLSCALRDGGYQVTNAVEVKVVKPRKIFNNNEVTKMVRFYTPSLYGACDALDLYDIDYDLDDGDRIMVDDSLYDAALDAFEEYDIEYEEV